MEIESVRETSIDAYHHIIESGVLGEAQRSVYKALVELGPSTGSEINYYMNKGRNPSHSNIVTRLGELRDMGAVKELGKVVCPVTKMKVIQWDITGDSPVKVKKLSKQEKKALALEKLREVYKEVPPLYLRTQIGLEEVAELIKRI